jgi:uracil phosphoribosyltransferase
MYSMYDVYRAHPISPTHRQEFHEPSAPHRPPAGPAQTDPDAPQGSVDQQLPPHAGRAVHADGLRNDARLPAAGHRDRNPHGKDDGKVIDGKKLALVSILRAGNGFLDGMLNVVPGARIGHIGLYRDPETLQPVEYYFKMPENMGERDVIVVDPMLATGNSAAAAVQQLKDKSAPKSIKFMCLLAAPEGIKTMQAAHPDVDIYTAAVDRELNDHGYILPGLGDAGDRIFGTK